MSKSVGKSKVTIELPKAKNLSDRLSVFQRLGNRGAASGASTKQKLTPLPTSSVSDKEGTGSAQESTPVPTQIQQQQQPEEPFPNASLKLQLVRQKAAAIMDSKRKQEQAPAPMPVTKKIRKVRISSPSSDSSSSSSGSSSSSSTSSPKRKVKKRQIRKRAPSSSSDEVRERKISKKKAHKKALEMKKAHHKKSKEMTRTLIKRAMSPPASYSRRQHEDSESPPKKIIVKVHKKDKSHKYHHEVAATAVVDREKLRVKERMRSPSPKLVLRRSRSPQRSSRELKRAVSPEMRRSPPRSYRSRERSSDRSPYKESRVERERRERKEYEMMREKERAEALARCQERQRERERLKMQREMEAREKYERSRPRSVERGRPRSRSRSYERHEPRPDRPEYDHRYEEPTTARGRGMEERSPVPREYRHDESPYTQDRRRYEHEDTSPHYRENIRRPEYQERTPIDHREDRRSNYERGETPRGEWMDRESGHKPQQYHERRPNYEEKEHWTPKDTRPPYKQQQQFHETPRYEHPGSSRQDAPPHHAPTHTPRGGMIKKYNPDWQHQHTERTMTYRPRGGFIPRHERPDTQSYRPRYPGAIRGGFRPTGLRMPGSFRGRGSFHPNITYFPSKHPHPNSQQMQHPGNQMQGVNPGDQPPHHKQMLRRQDGADEGDHLSEISDEGDEMLNKTEGRGRARLQQRHRQVAQGGLMAISGSSSESKNAGDPSVNQDEAGIDTKSHANKQLQEEMELDFEEISDGELDEENRKICLGDALGVDWSSIVEESKRKVKEESPLGVNTAKQKLKPHRVLLDVGVSAKMAGEEFAKQVILDSYACLEEEIREEIHVKALHDFSVKNEFGKDIKGEPVDDVPADTNLETNKTETLNLNLELIEQKVNEKLPFTRTGLIDRPYAFAQTAYKERLESRKKLIMNAIGPYSRALSARQDLKMRRKLCGLPEEETVEKVTVAVTPQPIEGSSDLADVPQTCAKQSSLELAFSMFKKIIEKAC